MTPEMRQAIAQVVKAWENADRVIALKTRWPELASAIEDLFEEYEKEN